MSRLKSQTACFLLLLFLASIGVCAFSAPLLTLGDGEHTFGRNDLWRVVNYLCLPSARIGLSFPCASVHPDSPGVAGWAVLSVGKLHFLTVPTERISGIESPLALAPASARYWEAAWDARSLIDAALGRKLPREAIGLAINSESARSQDQFHIHTSCIKPFVRAALARNRGRIGTQWVALRSSLLGHIFMVRRLDEASLGARNVIALLPPALTVDAATLANQTVIVVGATFDTGREGYYVLHAVADGVSNITGEALLDFQCS